MIYSMYVLVDTVSNVSDGIFLYRNDNHAKVELDARLNDSQRSRLSLRCIGTYDTESHIVVDSNCRDIGFISKAQGSLTGTPTPLDTGTALEQEQKFISKTADVGM